MKITKVQIAKRQIDTAIALFLSDRDFVSALTLAGAAEEILGAYVKRKNEEHVLAELHASYQEATGSVIEFGEFSRSANFTRNTLKHAKTPAEDDVVVCRCETVQMLMRAMINWRRLGHELDQQMLSFDAWLMAHRGAYENLE